MNKLFFKKLAVVVLLTFCITQLPGGIFLPQALADTMPMGGSGSTSPSTCAFHCNPGDEGRQEEHALLFDPSTGLVMGTADATAVNSGRWEDDTTWLNGIKPPAGGKVVIAQGVTVSINSIVNTKDTAYDWVRVDGTLMFQTATDADDAIIYVDTLAVHTMGTLMMGTEANPLDKGEAKIIISDKDVTQDARDPFQIGHGVIVHGTMVAYGQHREGHYALTQSATKGATSITMNIDASTFDWKVGDTLVLTGVKGGEDEDITIDSITQDGAGHATITFKTALKYDHVPPDPSFQVYVANVYRNVTIESSNFEDLHRRGHVMFMHTWKVNINYVGFYGLGRTDGRNVVTDTVIGPDGMPMGTENNRGRYGLHFHLAGTDPANPPAIVNGVANVGCAKFCFVNHGSNVNFTNNVGVGSRDDKGKGTGSIFFTEDGTETGIFDGNIAINAPGSGEGNESRKMGNGLIAADFGHDGNGFWFQGANVEVTNNVVAGAKVGYQFFTVPLKNNKTGVTPQVRADTLVDPAWANGKAYIAVGNVPIRKFDGNITYASGEGFHTQFHLLSVSDPSRRSLAENFLAWNVSTGSMNPYTNQTTFRNFTVIGDRNNPRGTGFARNDVTANIIYDNVTVEGFGVGIEVPVNGKNYILGGKFNNIKNINITSANMKREISIEGDIQFGTIPATILKNRKQYDIYLAVSYNPKMRDITTLFRADLIVLGTVQYNGQQLYYLEQAANFIPFPSSKVAALGYYPQELLDKTQQELMDQYGLALGGYVAPADSITDPRINGLIGPKVPALPELTLLSKKYTNVLTGYVLKYKDANGATVTDPTPVDLRQGWNLVTRVIGGVNRTFLVYGDQIPPVLNLSSSIPTALNPLDGDNFGITLKGKVDDDSTGTTEFKAMWTGKQFAALPRLTRPDGTTYVALSFKVPQDRAGNYALGFNFNGQFYAADPVTHMVTFEITLDPTLPLRSTAAQKPQPPLIPKNSAIWRLMMKLIGTRAERAIRLPGLI